MSITDWFSARESKRYTRMTEPPRSAGEVPDGVWVKCASCNKTVYERELTENLKVCPYCSHHMDMTGP